MRIEQEERYAEGRGNRLIVAYGPKGANAKFMSRIGLPLSGVIGLIVSAYGQWTDCFQDTCHAHNLQPRPPFLGCRDGNGYPKPDGFFTPLGYGFGSTFRPVDLLMGTKFYPLGLWA